MVPRELSRRGKTRTRTIRRFSCSLENGLFLPGPAVDQWARAREVELQFIVPVRPMQNGHRERLNGKFRDECLNQHGSRDVEDARQLTGEYRQDYNQQQPHSALGNLTPEEFVRRVAGAAPLGGQEGGESGNGISQVNQETMPTGLSLEVFQ